jgi:hypothetical protein
MSEHGILSVSGSQQILAKKGRDLSDCMLSVSTFTITGVVVGTVVGIRRKHLRPFVYAITAGTFADMIYGYTNKCRGLIDDYEACQRKHTKLLKLNKLNDNNDIDTK